MDRCLLPLLVSLFLAPASAAGQPLDERNQVGENRLVSTKNPYVFIEPGPVEETILYIDGSRVEVETEMVWRPISGSSLEGLTPNDFRRIVESHSAALENDAAAQEQSATQRGGGFDIIFTNLSGFNATSLASLAQVEAVMESAFDDNITIFIDIRFVSFGGCSAIGSAGSSYINVTWTNARNGLFNGKDTDDFIQDHLPPAAGTIPVRYDGNTSTVTNENRVFVTRANHIATIGASAGNAGSINMNSDCTFDFDPSNGVVGLDFQSVIVQEVGHVMGFTTGADFRNDDIELLDLYRFQRSDGAGTDFNPDTLAEFTTTARMVDLNAPGTINDVNSDLITVEHRMSDGSPSQASHLHDQNPPLGVMDPTLNSGFSYFPDFYRTPDLDLFDAIGWDITSIPDDLTPPAPSPMEWEAGGEPAGSSSSEMTMTAALATDPQNPSGSQNSVEYCLTGVSGPGVGTMCWQATRTFTDTGLTANTHYSYDARARDTAIPPNETLPSFPALSGTTFIETPSTFFVGPVTDTSIGITAFNPAGSFTNLTVGGSGLFYEMTPPGGVNANVWLQVQFVVITGLTPGTEYTVRVKARNQLGVETPFTVSQAISTTGGCTLVGDVNQDGLVNGEDIDGFVRAKLAQPPALGEEPLCADFGNGGDLALDTADFVNALLLD